MKPIIDNFTLKHRVLFLSLALMLSITSCNEGGETPDNTQGAEYALGDTGPGGGLVFYDKGEVSDGWRYIESSLTDMHEFEWGCFDTSIAGARQSEVGKGLENTEFIVDFHDGLYDFYSNPGNCSAMSNGTVAAKAAMEFSIDGFNDWHLPSKDEGALMYQNLHLNGLGNFDSNDLYWTSTEHDNNTAVTTNFDTGDQGFLCKQCHQVAELRVVRYF